MTVKKRRGGKRMRRLKERYEETTLMKQANTRAFSSKVGEYGDDAMGLTMGLLDTEDVSGTGVRKNTEKRKIRFANTKRRRERRLLHKQPKWRPRVDWPRVWCLHLYKEWSW